jgi:signal transduction histidine kinase
MARMPIRARVAPVAYAIVFGLAVVGFFRADREMVRAERERTALTASETATLVEVFLLRHSDRLHTAATLIGNRGLDSAWLADTLPTVMHRSGELVRQFDAISIVDSTGVVRASVSLRGGVVPLLSGSRPIPLTPSEARWQRLDRNQSDPETLLLVADLAASQKSLAFLDFVGTNGRVVIMGTTGVDSLAALLRARQRSARFGVAITSESDTILTVGVPVHGQSFRAVQRLVGIPGGSQWTVTMISSPSGRGVRIVLWIVGLGAVIGLGVGLLLERREVSRIADRSSELEHLSAELLRANRAKSEFLANVSHELRTPLNAIVGFVDLLRDGVYGPLNARQVGPVERIEASANHLRHLVDQVLDLAKMAAGRLEVHTEPLELRPFVFDVASEVEPLITEKGLSFSLAVGASLPRVRTDPTHLRQILINLLGNAVKFTASGGISVRGKLVGLEERHGMPAVITAASALLDRSPRPEGLWIVLQVADTGVGIPTKDRERIFDEFEQVNAGPRGDSIRRGTGLGLSISRRLARLLGGDITVESEPGRGSVFTVWLPVDPADLQGDRAA